MRKKIAENVTNEEIFHYLWVIEGFVKFSSKVRY